MSHRDNVAFNFLIWSFCICNAIKGIAIVIWHHVIYFVLIHMWSCDRFRQGGRKLIHLEREKFNWFDFKGM